jgi:histone acetyltransferase 1
VGEKIAAYKKNESYKGVNGANGNKKGKGKARACGSGIREKLEKWVPVKEGEDVEEEEVIYEAYRVSGLGFGSGPIVYVDMSPTGQTTWSTPGFREYHRRMQIFVLLLIEGGSYIDEDEDKWEFVVLYAVRFFCHGELRSSHLTTCFRYERRKRPKESSNTDNPFAYHFVGYTSLYSFFHWPDKIRLRLRYET